MRLLDEIQWAAWVGKQKALRVFRRLVLGERVQIAELEALDASYHDGTQRVSHYYIHLGFVGSNEDDAATLWNALENTPGVEDILPLEKEGQKYDGERALSTRWFIYHENGLSNAVMTKIRDTVKQLNEE